MPPSSTGSTKARRRAQSMNVTCQLRPASSRRRGPDHSSVRTVGSVVPNSVRPASTVNSEGAVREVVNSMNCRRPKRFSASGPMKSMTMLPVSVTGSGGCRGTCRPCRPGRGRAGRGVVRRRYGARLSAAVRARVVGRHCSGPQSTGARGADSVGQRPPPPARRTSPAVLAGPEKHTQLTDTLSGPSGQSERPPDPRDGRLRHSRALAAPRVLRCRATRGVPCILLMQSLGGSLEQPIPARPRGLAIAGAWQLLSPIASAETFQPPVSTIESNWRSNCFRSPADSRPRSRSGHPQQNVGRTPANPSSWTVRHRSEGEQ